MAISTKNKCESITCWLKIVKKIVPCAARVNGTSLASCMFYLTRCSKVRNQTKLLTFVLFRSQFQPPEPFSAPRSRKFSLPGSQFQLLGSQVLPPRLSISPPALSTKKSHNFRVYTMFNHRLQKLSLQRSASKAQVQHPNLIVRLRNSICN